jgi:ATP-dependent Clp protease ATP-binding subunit ClpC
MENRITDRFRKLLRLAESEARALKHEYVGTEHLLLALVRDGSGVGAHVLKNLHVDLDAVIQDTVKYIGPGKANPIFPEALPHTPRAKKVVEFAIEESRGLKHNFIGSEHLLLGLLREEEGFAAQLLMNHGLTLDKARPELIATLGANR